jgi:hypothetical protein
MSFPKELDDYTTGQLGEEIARRRRCQKAGTCWYCGKPLDSHTCRMRMRKDVQAPEKWETNDT